jgi:hypothetical protein
MNIPSKVQLYGKTIKILMEGNAKKMPKGRQCVGYSKYPDNTITVFTKDSDGNPLCDDNIMETFLHELTHFMLHELNSDDASNELIVDGLANILHQVLPQLEETNAKRNGKEAKIKGEKNGVR